MGKGFISIFTYFFLAVSIRIEITPLVSKLMLYRLPSQWHLRDLTCDTITTVYHCGRVCFCELGACGKFSKLTLPLWFGLLRNPSHHWPAFVHTSLMRGKLFKF